MKTPLKVILASLVLFASHAFGQTTATTDPVGVKPRTAPVPITAPTATITSRETGTIRETSTINANQTQHTPNATPNSTPVHASETGAPNATAGTLNSKPVKSPRDSASGQRRTQAQRTTQHPKPPAKK